MVGSAAQRGHGKVLQVAVGAWAAPAPPGAVPHSPHPTAPPQHSPLVLLTTPPRSSQSPTNLPCVAPGWGSWEAVGSGGGRRLAPPHTRTAPTEPAPCLHPSVPGASSGGCGGSALAPRGGPCPTLTPQPPQSSGPTAGGSLRAAAARPGRSRGWWGPRPRVPTPARAGPQHGCPTQPGPRTPAPGGSGRAGEPPQHQEPPAGMTPGPVSMATREAP